MEMTIYTRIVKKKSNFIGQYYQCHGKMEKSRRYFDLFCRNYFLIDTLNEYKILI